MKNMLFDQKLIRFLLVGVANTIVGAGLMFILYNALGVSYWLSSVCNLAAGGMFLAKLRSLIAAGKIAAESRIIFVDDGSSDSTWQIITGLSQTDGACTGIRLSRNRGIRTRCSRG